ncbi:MAG: alkaline phosphatase D family protein [Gemmataceae bacterium]
MLRYLFVLAVSAFTVLAPASASPPLPLDKPLSKIVFGSCADQNKPCPIWTTIGQQKPDVLLLMGDNIYADIEGGKRVDSNPAIIAKSYAELLKVESFVALKNKFPLLTMWDDHDYGKNDAGAEWKYKDQSKKLFLEFWDVPPSDPRWKRSGIYHSAIAGPVGKRIQFILLDNRFNLTVPKQGPRRVLPGYGSSPIAPYLPTTDANATVLGEEQWAWLKEELQKPAEIRLICSGIQVLPDEHPFEKWANHPRERQRLFDLIRETNASGVVLLSGDRHLGEMLVSTDAVSYPLFECTSSGFNQGTKNWRPPEKSRYRIGGMPYGDNFGMILVDWEQSNPKITMQLRDEAGDVQIAHSFRLGMLQTKPEKKGSKPAAKDKEGDKPADEPKRPDGVLSPEQALAKMDGDAVQVQFTVAGGRSVSMGKRILLNSDKDFQSEKNFTVVVNEKAMTGPFDKATLDTFKGKTIRVKGKLSTYQSRLQIQINDAKDIELVTSGKPKGNE